MHGKLWVVGCAQNCADPLPAVLANVEALRQRFKASRVLLLENDSTDATREVIAAYGQVYKGVQAIGFASLNQRIPEKTLRLAHLRNGALAWLKQQETFEAQDLVLVLDLDEVNAAPWDQDVIEKVLVWFSGQTRAAGVFANQLGPYYDLWALRHPQLCAGDIWEQVLRTHWAEPTLTDHELFERIYQPRQLAFDPAAEPFQVDSAFGGLGFYKSDWLATNGLAYRGEQTLLLERQGQPHLIRMQVAEHVAFHLGLRAAGGELWIHPALLNWDTNAAAAAGMRPNPASWRHLSF
ncbi:MAG: hypothetical protein EBS53_01435 [Bacteroidetes bacterium]|nr:hypothetical protein [Bacteroidota bacterium]